MGSERGWDGSFPQIFADFRRWEMKGSGLGRGERWEFPADFRRMGMGGSRLGGSGEGRHEACPYGSGGGEIGPRPARIGELEECD